MWRHLASNFLTVLIVLLVGLVGLVGWAKREYGGPGPLTQAICLKVERGSNFRQVAEDLKAEGAIRYPYIFKVGADYAGRAEQLKAGSYLIEPSASMAGIVDTVAGTGVSTCGTEVNFRIGVAGTTIVVSELDPATLKLAEVAKFDPAAEAAPAAYAEAEAEQDTRLKVKLVEGLKAAEFLAGEVKDVPVEGSLAPQQYEVEPGADRGGLIAEMQAAQAAILAELWEGRAKGLPYETPEEAMVMASIVEKETGVAEERPRVASVFLNRLKQGMKLQTDPTVIYGLTKGQGILGRGLRQSELRSNTPYNTYVIDGLPPGPIANPGRDSIAAALNPDTTDYLFFVADGTGGHAFAATLEEHNQNVERWRKIEAEQQQNQEDQGN
jgi:UPF0755 protein